MISLHYTFGARILVDTGFAWMQGCGIVEYSTKEEAQNAINMMSNKNLMGRLIYVREVSNSSLTMLNPSNTFIGPRD